MGGDPWRDQLYVAARRGLHGAHGRAVILGGAQPPAI